MHALAAFAAFGVFALPAAAQTAVYDPLTTSDVTRLLTGLGYEATVDAADEEHEGDYINSKFERISYWIHFTACDENSTDCEVIVFDAGFSYTDNKNRPALEKINEWNEYNLGKAGLDDKGDPYINLEVNIVGGVTHANMVDNISWWKNMLGEFTDFINWD